MGSLLVTIPVTLLLGAVLLVLVVRAARRGDYDDWEGPAHRMLFDEDSVPEVERDAAAEAEAAPEDRDRGESRGPDRTM